MKEHNYHTLRQALDKLPTFDAPENLWDQLAGGLNESPKPTVLSSSLPNYSPPTAVWNQLNNRLDLMANQRGKRRMLYRWTARAAAVLIIFSAGYWFATYDAGPKISFVYGEEVHPNATFTADWNDEEARFQRVMEQLQAIDEPELNALRLELEELTAAKKAVEDMLMAYGRDNNIISQLAEIETERSRVYRLVINEL